MLQGRLLATATPVNEAIVHATRHLATSRGLPRSLDARVVLDQLNHLDQ